MKTSRFVFLLTAALSLTALSSCGGKAPEKVRVDHVYGTTLLSLPDGFMPDELLACPDGGFILAGSDSSGDGVTPVVLTVADDLSVTSRTDVGSDCGSLRGTALRPDDSALILTDRYDEESGETLLGIASLKDGKTDILTGDILGDLEKSGAELPDGGRFGLFPSGIAIDSDGRVYLFADSDIIILGSDLGFITAIQAEGSISGFGTASDGRVGVLVSSRRGGATVSYIGTDTWELTGGIDLPSKSGRTPDILFGGGYEFFYNDWNSVFGVSAADDGSADMSELMNFINSDVIANSVSRFCVRDESRFAGTTDVLNQDGGFDHSELLVFDRVPDDEVPEKYVLELAVAHTGMSLPEQIVRFNRSSEEYRVRLSVYDQYDEETGNVGEMTLEKRLMSSDTPDIVWLYGFGRAEDWMSAGIFTDLYKVMERDKFDRSLLFENVVDCVKRGGKLYGMPVRFSLGTLAAKRSVVGMDSWTVDEFIDYMENLPDGTYPFEFASRKGMLDVLTELTMSSFIDWETAECSFDSAEFGKILAFAARYPEEWRYSKSISGDDLEDYRADSRKPLLDGKLIFQRFSIYDISQILSAKYHFGTGDCVFIGYPRGESSGGGTSVIPTSCFGIPEKSSLKDGAWEFIKYVMSDGERDIDMGFPILREAFARESAEDLKRSFIMKSDGYLNLGEHVDPDIVKKITAESGGEYFEVSEQDISMIESLISDAAPGNMADQTVTGIINEEAEAYFSGDKTLEEVQKIIQDRVGTYLAERQ